jgi:hypothetical protein
LATLLTHPLSSFIQSKDAIPLSIPPVSSEGLVLEELEKERGSIISQEDTMPLLDPLGVRMLPLGKSVARIMGWERAYTHYENTLNLQTMRAYCIQIKEMLKNKKFPSSNLEASTLYAINQAGFGECQELSYTAFFKLILKGIENVAFVTSHRKDMSDSHCFILLNSPKKDFPNFKNKQTLEILCKLNNVRIYDPLLRCTFPATQAKTHAIFSNYMKEGNYTDRSNIVFANELSKKMVVEIMKGGQMICTYAQTLIPSDVFHTLTPFTQHLRNVLKDLEVTELFIEKLTSLFHALAPDQKWKKSNKSGVKIWIKTSYRLANTVAHHLKAISTLNTVSSSEEFCVVLTNPKWKDLRVIPNYDNAVHANLRNELESTLPRSMGDEAKRSELITLISAYDI